MKPKISVIMSVYNGARHLTESVESILAQTYGDFEFLIVDDGSTDNSLEIIHDFAKKEKRITIIQNEKNIGLTKSLNRALKQARGTYIARHDADDVAMPGRFEEQVSVLEEKPEYDVLGTNYCVVDTDGRDVDKTFPSHYADDTRRAFLHGRNPLCHSSVMFRKKMVEKVGYYDETYRYAQDYELWLRLIAQDHGIHNIPRKLQKLRRSGEETTGTRRRPHLKCVIRIRVKYLRYFGRNINYIGLLILDCFRILMPGSTRTFVRHSK